MITRMFLKSVVLMLAAFLLPASGAHATTYCGTPGVVTLYAGQTISAGTVTVANEIQGVLLVETLHLFPLMTLSIVDALGKISPSLDEAAESVGSRGLRKFWDITFPLTTPGYVSGALLVFIWTFADFATPLVVGVSDLLASQAYLNIGQFVDRRLFKMGIVISAIMVILAILFLIFAKQYVAIKDYSSLAYSKIERKKLSAMRRAGAVIFLTVVLIFAFIPYLGIALDSFGKGWALTPFPVCRPE